MREIKRTKSTFVQKVGDAIDNALAIVAPAAAFKRIAYRKAANTLSSYRGASKDRTRENWLPGNGSADSDILPELSDLRERSRDLNRNDPTASGITNTVVTNVIGTGIRPQSRIDKKSLNISDDEAREFQKVSERVWERWVPYADAGNRMDFYEIEALVDRQILENGEAILLPLMIEEVGRPYKLAFDIIESDRLDTPFDKKGDKAIRHGVQIGDRGQPLAYYIKKTHPGDVALSKKWVSDDFIKYAAVNAAGRKNILHLYYVLRPGQTRGVPFFAPVLSYFKNFADYLEAEIVTARIAACFSLFIKKEDPAGAALARTTNTNTKGQRIEELEPGIVEYLAPGESIETLNPNRQGGPFDQFTDRILRLICAALNLPYEIVAKDFSKTNYSSARAALLEARRYFKMRQEWLAKKLCQAAWEMLIEEAFLKGELTAATFYKQRDDWLRAKWITPGWAWVDPVKEVEASTLAVKSGLSTLAEEAASQGRDWEDNLEQIAREREKKKELGIPEASEITQKLLNPDQPVMSDEGMRKKIIDTGQILGDEIDEQIRGSLKEAGAIS